jgi:two-component system sensor histidine kinase DegS
MNRQILNWSRRYQAALTNHLNADDRESLEAVRGLGSEILADGLPMLELAKLHEQFLISELLPGYPAKKRAALIKRAGKFFAAAVVPIGKTPLPGAECITVLEETVEMLSQRTVGLAASNLALSAEITRRKSVEKALKQEKRGYARMIKESAVLQEQLRHLSRQILSAQENERKKISRELHDMVAQTLTGINIRLAALKAGATLDTRSLAQNIAETQRLVEHSVDLVHRFARELRPAMLDHLGLIPALQAFMKSFTERTGVRTHLTAFAGVELLNMPRRTALFRVAQEALTNVGRHAQASRVEVSIEKRPDGACMKIADDGKSFQVQRVLLARGSKRLGLLGMRERLEMVGGRFWVESAPGKGTVIEAFVPDARATGGKGKRR